MMNTKTLKIGNVPALLLGEESDKVFLYVHGKMGCKGEALPFAQAAQEAGYQVLAIDLPEHGARKDASQKLLPWVVMPELELVYAYLRRHWKSVSLYAVSIGAWLSMQALADKKLEKILLVSPVVDMNDLITHMMGWANVTEQQLQQAGEIPTDFGETLSWEYLCWVRQHPLRWKNRRTQVLYGDKDNLTALSVMQRFKQSSVAHLTIVEDGEHWFHTETQLYILRAWEENCLKTILL